MNHSETVNLLFPYIFLIIVSVFSFTLTNIVDQTHSHLRARQPIEVAIAYWRAIAAKTGASAVGFAVSLYYLLDGKVWHEGDVVYRLTLALTFSGAVITAFGLQNIWTRSVIEDGAPNVKDITSDMDRWHIRLRILQYLSLVLLGLAFYQIYQLSKVMGDELPTSVGRLTV